MPSSTIRKSIWGVTAIAAVALLVLTALPWIASTRIVRDRIALELSAWSGYRVELAGGPEIQIWPTFKAVLNDVSLSDWDDQSRRPVLDAETVELELSPIAALQGKVVFSNAKLVRPVLYVNEVRPNRYAPVAPKIGRIWHAIEGARAIVAENPSNPRVAALADDSFGTVEFSDGRIVSPGDDDEPLVTGLAGAIEWSALNSAANLSVNGIWRGENLSIEASSARPLILFAGGSAPITLNIRSAPASGSFDGVVNLAKSSFFNGQVTFNSPSLRRMLEWARTDLPAGASSGPVALSGRITGTRQRFKLENAEINLEDRPGTGVLELTLGAVPSITGTLAFDQLDLRSFLSSFTPFSPGDQNEPSAVDVAFAEKYNLDLRLSAANATAGDLAFTNVAATAQVRGDLAAFDISDATIFGGTVQAGLRYDRKGKSRGNLDIRLLASDIDTAAAANVFRSMRPPPSGRTTISLMLKGPGHDRDSFLQTAAGTFSMTFGPGAINGFDLAAFINRVNQGGFFPLREVASGSLAVDRAEVRATLSEGTARIEAARLKLGDRAVTLSGVIPYAVGGLALSGAVIPANAPPDQPDAAEASFFVGGSWAAPFVSPTFGNTFFKRPQPDQND